MDDTLPRQILIAGAGIAGMTAALAFSQRGFSVQLFEKIERFEEIGAGLQLSPNATAVLRDLGVLGSLKGAALRPEAVVLRDARSLGEATRIPLGDLAESRWGAPYLAVHRADLMSVLASHVSRDPDIRLVQGATLRDFALHAQGVTASIDIGATIVEASGRLLVGADGVWSSVRGMAGESGKSLFSGNIAWRATIRGESDVGRALTAITGLDRVTAFMHPTAHLIVYPMRGGEAINLVAVTKGAGMEQEWGGRPNQEALQKAMAGAAPALYRLVEDAGPWTAWPLHTVDPANRWTISGGVALIGDAAHAMTPFAAQGAAMAIEDAATLASMVAANPQDLAGALAAWELERRKRVAKVVKRGALNHYAWHASGLVAVARDLFLKTRSPNRLAADLDWLYGWTVSG